MKGQYKHLRTVSCCLLPLKQVGSRWWRLSKPTCLPCDRIGRQELRLLVWRSKAGSLPEPPYPCPGTPCSRAGCTGCGLAACARDLVSVGSSCGAALSLFPLPAPQGWLALHPYLGPSISGMPSTPETALLALLILTVPRNIVVVRQRIEVFSLLTLTVFRN